MLLPHVAKIPAAGQEFCCDLKLGNRKSQIANRKFLPMPTPSDSSLKFARELSPRRSTSTATDVDGLVAEQLSHFAIDPATEMGRTLGRLAGHIYRANIELHFLWELTVRELGRLDRRDRIGAFNAKKL